MVSDNTRTKTDKPDPENSENGLAVALTRQRVAEEAPVILWLTGPDGRHHYFNSRWREFTGLENTDDPEGKIWLQALHPEDRDQCVQTILTAFSEHKSLRLIYRLRDRNGEYRWMLDQSRPCYEKNGDFCGYVGAVVDISEQKKAETALEASNYNLTRANKHAQINRQMNDHLQVCNDMQEVHAVLSHFVPQLFSRSSGAVYMVNESRSLIEAVTSWGNVENRQVCFSREDCWALRQGKTHRVTGKQGVVCTHLNGWPLYGYICIPLISHGDVMGLLYLQNNYADQMADEYRYELAQNTSENLSLALSSFRLRQALRHQSVRDPLTRLYNRRYMIESLEREIARMRREERQLAVIMLDLDHFKRFNDNHGHAAGDIVLQELARFFRDNLRTEDVASRYGGEEFTIVMSNVSAENARQRAEILRQGVQGLSVNFQNQCLDGFTMSMGLAIYPQQGSTAESLLEAADRALYRAKRNGRNRLCLASNDEPGGVGGVYS